MKKASPYKVVKRRNGRHVVRMRGGKLVNGPEKTKILIEAGLVKKLKPKAKDAAPAADAPAEQ